MNSHDYYFVRVHIRGERDITYSNIYKAEFRETPDDTFFRMFNHLREEYPNHVIDVLQFNFLCSI